VRAIQLCGVRQRCDPSSLVVDSTRLGTSQPSGNDDRMPEQHSEESNHNNPNNKTPRVAIKGLVVVRGQPVGIAHAKLLGRPPASQPHRTLIKTPGQGLPPSQGPRFGHSGSTLRQAGQIIFQEFGGSPGNAYTWVELHDDLTVSLLQARLIERNLPISVEIGTRD
jgi:hypothetical protein